MNTVEEIYVPNDNVHNFKPIQYILNGDCWDCISHSGNRGYPVVKRNGTRTYISRYMYTMFVEEISEGNCILHSCDNPKCINPNHLSQGTKGENVADMVSKSRQSRGTTHNRKLSHEDVREIKKLLMSGLSQEKIGKIFGVGQSSIYKISSGHSYDYIKVDENYDES